MVQVLSGHRGRYADSHHAKLPHRPTRLRDGQRNILQRHDAHRLESVRVSRAELRDVVIARPAERQSESRIAQSATREAKAPKYDLNVDAFSLEVLQPGFRIG